MKKEKLKVRAVSDRIIVKVRVDEMKTKSGIIIPQTNAKERYYEGEVVDLTDHHSVVESGVKVGDYVFYQKGYNIEVTDKDTGVMYDIVEIFDVLAYIPKEEK